MTEKKNSPEATEEAVEHQSIVSLVSRFFTIPLTIVLICVGIFYFFGTLAHDKKTIDDYLDEIKGGSANRRWQAAYELSKQVRQSRVKGKQADKVVATLSEIYFKEANEEDSRLRQYAILCLAELGSPNAEKVFVESLKDSSSDVVVYTLWGLGTLKNSDNAELIRPFLNNEDPALRKVAAYSLGVLGDSSSIPLLKKGLKDPIADVQWNAALALAQLNDDSGLQVIQQILDPTYLGQFQNMSEPQRVAVIESALKGVILLKDQSALPLLQQLAKTETRPALQEQILKVVDSLK